MSWSLSCTSHNRLTSSSASTTTSRGSGQQRSPWLCQEVTGWHALHVFHPLIINYESPRGFMVLKFSTYDGTSDSFHHIMHYKQLMTLNIGNDALLCKVFSASLHGQALSWFHRLQMNSMNNFRDLSEAFVGQYLCSTWHKQNINTLQNINIQENESLREFVKRFK